MYLQNNPLICGIVKSCMKLDNSIVFPFGEMEVMVYFERLKRNVKNSWTWVLHLDAWVVLCTAWVSKTSFLLLKGLFIWLTFFDETRRKDSPLPLHCCTFHSLGLLKLRSNGDQRKQHTHFTFKSFLVTRHGFFPKLSWTTEKLLYNFNREISLFSDFLT